MLSAALRPFVRSKGTSLKSLFEVPHQTVTQRKADAEASARITLPLAMSPARESKMSRMGESSELP